MKKNLLLISLFILTIAILIDFSNETHIATLKENELDDIIHNIDGKSQGDIPVRYSQELNLDKTYVYNFTYWEEGEIISYYTYGPPYNDLGDMNASTGGQIHVNFTGFYDKHPKWG